MKKQDTLRKIKAAVGTSGTSPLHISGIGHVTGRSQFVDDMAIADKEFVTRLYFDGPVEDWLPDFEMNERHPEAYRYRFLEFESLPQMEYRWDLTKGMSQSGQVGEIYGYQP